MMRGVAKRMVSRAERSRRETVVEGLWSNQMTIAQICAIVGRELTLGPNAVKVILKRVQERAMAEHEADRAANKSRQALRLGRQLRKAQAHLDAAETAGDRSRLHNSVVQIEKLLADVLGTREPVQVNATLAVHGALQQVVANLTPEMVAQIAGEQLAYEMGAEPAQLPPGEPAATRVAARHEPPHGSEADGRTARR